MSLEKEVIRVSNELQHHGIKGQKWGVRRYQNADGTLTAEGLALSFATTAVFEYASKERAVSKLDKKYD